MIVEGGDRRIDLDTPIGFELLGDPAVDVAIGPDDEVEAIDLALRRHAPRTALLAEGGARESRHAETRRCAENATPAQLPFSDETVTHVALPFAQVMIKPITSPWRDVAIIEQKAGHGGLSARMRVEALA